ncbi:hypothetical protein [Hafnia alvei]|uniref:hypothetical protein n=1 Tax=Hafnia alvei TaxID=569 RepID=UPI0024A8E5C3|nr:hypothetical protein [Hafnia alvei]
MNMMTNVPAKIWVLISSFFILMLLLCLWWAHEDESTNLPIVALSSIQGDYDKNLLTHRLIMLDEKYNLASQDEVNTALSNSLFFLSKVKQHCNTYTDNLSFLQCANNILGTYFTYKETTRVSKGYSHAETDCDLNVYLLLDAAKMFNKQISIIYGPNHAFIAYIDNQGNTQYWETISPNNYGHPADLWTSEYVKTLHSFFYSPQPIAKIENIYSLYLLPYLSHDNKEHILSTLYNTLHDNPIYLSAYYGSKDKTTETDVNQLLHLLQRDTSSFDKKIIAARFFIDNNNISKARALLSEIPKSMCTLVCLRLKERTSWTYIPYIYLAQFNIIKSEADIDIAIDILKDSSFIIMILFALEYILQRIRKIHQGNKNHHRM